MKPEILTACIVAMISLSSSCDKTSSSTANLEPCTIQADSAAIASKLLTLPFVEKIMGEPAILTCNTFIKKGDTLEYKCDYAALSKDANSDKAIKIYFMYEVYAGTTAAENAYTSIFRANSGHEGIETMPNLGNEAYYHSDGTNFYFLLVRKNEKMIRLKLNKITSHSSEAKFKEVTRLILDKL